MLGRSRQAVKRLRDGSVAQPSPSRRKRHRATPPNVIGKGPLLSAPGLGLGVVVIIRDEAPYLTEWLAYHHALGVQHFFIYDNGSTDELHEVIEPWVNHGLVTLAHWPLPGGQIDAYSHALRFYGPSVDWLAYFDVDEFVVPLVDDDIPTLLARWPDAADVRIPRVDFGFSGHRTPPGELAIEAYTEVADVFGRDPSKAPRVKTVLQPRGISAVGIHTATVADAPLSADGQPVPTETVGKACWDYAQLNHYYTRSLEEFEDKRFRGSATGRIARPAIPFDLPPLRVDTSAQRFAERTRAMIERIGSLAPSPYRYGSELALTQFPRFNDLGLFSEFAIANTVMEEPAPRREPALRIENRYSGIGFVGVVSGYDHQVTEGELSASMHLAPLLERCRGRLVATLPDGRVGDGEVLFDIDAAGERRVYAVGFVVTSPVQARLGAELVRTDGTSSETIDVKLDAGSTYAGVVELDASPDLVSGVTLHLPSVEGGAILHDLFVISYG
ncbi:MAG: glycosyltransferase family 92 protein [Chloroflexota bacterium]|nr:glycosyltransferase family 92 protein [Chloroflexota bacterium]